MFSLNCFITTSNFILISWKVCQKMKPTGLLCADLVTPRQDQGQWKWYKMVEDNDAYKHGMKEFGGTVCMQCPMLKFLPCKIASRIYGHMIFIYGSKNHQQVVLRTHLIKSYVSCHWSPFMTGNPNSRGRGLTCLPPPNCPSLLASAIDTPAQRSKRMYLYAYSGISINELAGSLLCITYVFLFSCSHTFPLQISSKYLLTLSQTNSFWIILNFYILAKCDIQEC